MKIICVGRNYGAHALELNNDVPTEPVIFMKPQSALLLNKRPFYYPDFTQNLHYEGELVLRICKNGKSVQPPFAHRYFDAIAFGIDFTARDLQDQLKAKALPWELAKGFDGAAVLGDFLPVSDLNRNAIVFETRLNEKTVQNGNSADMIFSFEQIICFVSKYYMLQMGDLIYTGTPAGVGPVQQGDLLEGYIENKKLLHCRIK